MEGGRPSGLAGSLLGSILGQLPLSIPLTAEGVFELVQRVNKPTGNHTGEVHDAFPSFSPTKEKNHETRNMANNRRITISDKFRMN